MLLQATSKVTMDSNSKLRGTSRRNQEAALCAPGDKVACDDNLGLIVPIGYPDAFYSCDGFRSILCFIRTFVSQILAWIFGFS